MKLSQNETLIVIIIAIIVIIFNWHIISTWGAWEFHYLYIKFVQNHLQYCFYNIMLILLALLTLFPLFQTQIIVRLALYLGIFHYCIELFVKAWDN